ncbi:Aminoglycoside phosphotransferase [Penicillium robsamsonii]|uniref:Aminoglycoside phosphotransferase n=1 Tax=Penicillium robsamsonii TaxID=1792511 RepID=UPI002549277D|nr:Aminoglycoside phosphotransferase [Penicillium robsamsonii]KAJ5826929.1 Aminoglycoside phosphotransferase [Penicillium robsamsonii]
MCTHRGPLQEVDNDLESQINHKYYEAQVYKQSPRYWFALEDNRIPIIRNPLWKNRDLFFLRKSLMSLFADWEELVPDIPCPIKLTIEDVELHSMEEENINGVRKLLTLFRDEALLPVDGMIEPKDYDTAQKNSRKF